MIQKLTTRCQQHLTQVVQGFPNSQLHSCQMIQKHTSRCQHHLTKIVQKFPIRYQHHIQIRNQQVREGDLMNPKSLMNPSRKYLGIIFLVYPKNQTKMEKLKLRFPFKRCLGMPFQVYLKIKFFLIPLIQIMPKSTWSVSHGRMKNKNLRLIQLNLNPVI